MTESPTQPNRTLRPGWVWLVSTLLVGLACSFALWDPLDIDERAHVRRLTTQSARSVRADLQSDMHSHLFAEVRLAEMWAAEEQRSTEDAVAWAFRSGLLLDHHRTDLGLLWLDSTARARRIFARRGDQQEMLRLAVEQHLASLLGRLGGRGSADAAVSPSFQLSDGTQAAALVVPVARRDQLAGYLVAVLDVAATINALLVDHRDLGYAVSVSEGEREIYRTPQANRDHEQAWGQTVVLGLPGIDWRIRVWPDPAMLAEMRSPLPELALVLGGLLGFMLMVTLHFGRATRLTSDELRKAHDLLEERVKERTLELQTLSGRLLQLQDDERRRIARELHDSTAQMIGAAAMAVESARKLAAHHADGRLQEVLLDAWTHVDRVMQEIRTVSYLLHPPMLDDLGLEYVLPWYVAGFSARSGVAIDLQIAPDFGRLPHDIELTLFRIAQEGLTNVHRHSGSRTALITLHRNASAAYLEIRDEGRGLPPNTIGSGSDPSLGVGLAGMRERVRQFGGTLEIQSRGQGTVVRAVLPLPGA